MHKRKMCIYIPVWIDLKNNQVFKKRTYYGDLHSSMDRFEVISFVFSEFDFKIYIPVWIDLKTPQQVRTALDNTNLHSSMDRFEALISSREQTG